MPLKTRQTKPAQSKADQSQSNQLKSNPLKPGQLKPSQQQRADATIDLLVQSATRLFGERGYANTTLEDIALDCGLTIGAIYHHFGNKKALFAAANEVAERRIIETDANVADGEMLNLFQKRWKALLTLCNEPGFRQIVLIDSPNVLGRDRWVNSEVSKNARALATSSARRNVELELALRIMRGAAAEAILAVAEANNTAATRRIVDGIINRLLTVIVDDFAADPS
ncbi:MAG TPA: helix-turn-helix domain-containing protein [Spongiibacteraceae bacterium]|nr:helix-turn-helix domain-containing protein [Spongiibacteraceae bacterium]